MSCTACHLAWPILNQQGQAFRDNGYQFGTEKDEPATVAPAYWPASIRTTPAYQYTRTTNNESDRGPITVGSGGLPAGPAADLLTAGTIARDISYLVVVAGFTPDEPAALESAFVRLSNLGGSSWANLKVGKFEVDLPASAHRGVALTNGYAIYSPRPGSAVPLDLSANQVGVEFDGHDAGSMTRYAVSLVSANDDPGGKGPWSSPLVYAHAQRSFETSSELMPWIRVGALASLGWIPTAFETTGGGAENIAGTGHAYKTYSRLGGEVTGVIGDPASPLQWQVAFLHGQESAGATPGAPKATFSGGWLELNWVPISRNDYNATPYLVFARYDMVRQGEGPGDFDGLTLGVRRYLAVGPRASAAVHLEVSGGNSKQTAYQGGDVQTTAVMAGIDFAF
jgi:hypothetical protein